VTDRHGVFIVGMHRSGTSTLARLLARLGGQLPASPMPAGPDNPAGYFESQAIYLLNEQLLAHLDAGWDDLRPFPESWLESSEAERWVEGLAEALALEFEGSGWFVLKDPRLIWMLPLWKRAVAALGLTASWIVAVRDPVQAADSLVEAEGLDPARALALWLHQLTTAERSTRGERRAFLAYEELGWSAESAIGRLERELGVDLVPAGGWQQERCAEFVRPPAVRPAATTAAAARDAALAGWLGSAHRWILAVVGYGQPPIEVMDRIRVGLRAAIEQGRFGDPRGVHARLRSAGPGLRPAAERDRPQEP